MVLAGVVLTAQSQSPMSLRDDAPSVHTVVAGDTLWDVAARFLEQPWQWPQIWRVNPNLDNPHLIYPGDRIRLQQEAGEPALVLERGDPARTVKRSPERERLQPRVREQPLASAIPAIDLETIGPFLSGMRIVTRATLEEAPYVVQGQSGRLLTGAGDRMYARGANLPGRNEVAAVVRPGAELIDPDSGESLGLEAREVGMARVTDRQGELATLIVSRSQQDIRIGDRLLATDARTLAPQFHPRPPEADLSGRLVRVLDGVSQVGQYSVVAINLGEANGLAPGHVLAIRQQGRRVRDPVRGDHIRLPSEHAGLLMVFRVFDRAAYGLVMEALRPLAVMDEVITPR